MAEDREKMPSSEQEIINLIEKKIGILFSDKNVIKKQH